MVEASASRSRDMGDHSIEHLATLLVGIEVLIQQVTQKAPALRNSERCGTSHVRRRLVIKF